MKIADAKTKWCPFSRALMLSVTTYPPVGDPPVQVAPNLKLGMNASAGSFNRYQPEQAALSIGPPSGCNCIATDCMAWRWKPNPADFAAATIPSGPDAEGYCGLAAHAGAP